MKRALWKRSMAIALSIIIMFSGNQTAFSMETGSTNEPAAVQEQEDRDDGIVTETASDAEEGNAEAEEMQASEEADQGDSDADQPPGSEEEAGSEIEDASGESGVSSYADSSEEAAAADSTQETVSDEDAAADSTQEAAPEEEPDGTQETVSDEDAAAYSTQEAAPEEEPENADLGMTVQDTASAMPAQTFRAESDQGIIVEAQVDEGVLPENTVIKVEDITKKEAMDVAQDQSEGLEGQEVKDAVGVNITFLDAEGNEIQPADDSKVRVKISLPKEQKLDKEEAEDKESAFAVLHVDEKGEVTEVEEAEADVNGAEFDAEAFSVYVIASYTLETYFRSFSGENYKITVEFDDTAEIPVGSELYVTEILPDTEEYKAYLSDTRAAMDIEELHQITFARYFDIEIRNDGEKVEPNKPVKVKIEYADAMERSGDDTFSIIHFAEDGTEVISDVQVSSDNKEIVYEQNSFSVTGTIISGNPSNGTTYAVVVKDNATGKYYAVENDGRLVEVEYREENNTAYVTLDHPYMWTYESAHDQIADDGTNYEYDEEAENAPYNIRVHADARGYDGNQLPVGNYFRYISPVSDNGIEEETKEQPSHSYFKGRNLIAYENHTVHGVDWDNNNTDNYIGADFENLHITGNESSGNAVPVYLARIESVPGVGAAHETVSHIDIAIYGKGYLDVPLAYGTYYDENGREVLTVTAGNNVTLKLEKDIDITKEDMMRASLEAYDKNGNELSDAFYITGYSSNQQTDHSAVQVRMEGSFKVSTLGDYTGSAMHPNLDSDWCARRLDNQVYYRVSTIKDVPFELIYNGQQLYDKNGRALSVTSKCNMTAGFSYWDEGNECPPVLSDFEQKYHLYDGVPGSYQGRNNDLWTHGAIIDNTWNWPYYRGDSGMDFVLGNREDSQNKIVAVEIVKMIVDENGNRISPSKDVKNDFTLYYNKDESGASQSSIHDYAISPDRASADEVKALYGGYDDVRTEEIVVGSDGIGSIYDYQVEPGMFYVEEDAGKMGENGENSQITDTDGNTWTYKETYVETEYVWRNNEHNGGYHVAEGYSSVPEILGEYFDDNGNPQRNGFLEFYVYNVYEKPEPHKKEVTPYEGTGVLGPVKVGDRITYEISYKNYKTEAADVKIKDTLDPNVKYISSSPEGQLTGGPDAGGTVNWTITNVPAGTEGSVTLTVEVLEGALQSKGGKGKVVNGGDSTTVQVGNDKEYSVEVVENPVPEPPHKKETEPYEGTGTLGPVKVGDEITYEISYRNYLNDAANVVIKDTLDPNVEFVRATDDGAYDEDTHAVNWTIEAVPAGEEGSVTLTVKVLKGALQSKGGKGKVVNGGDSTTVKVGNDKEYSVESVENPVPEPPVKKETAPYEGTGELGAVKVGDEITYEISYRNYKSDKADVVIKDTLDPNVEFVSASDDGAYDKDAHVVNWTVKDVEAGKDGTVTLIVKVLEGALQSEGGEGEVVNGGPGTTVKVGNDNGYDVNTVTNPVPEEPHKKEIDPYEGTGVLGAVKVGDEITYEISYKNYKKDTADVTIKDTLDPNVEFVSASDGGAKTGAAVYWTIKDVEAGKEGKVTLTVKVLEGALQSKGGEGKVVNGGDSTTVKVGNDQEYSVESVENPVPEPPVKKETAPYEGTGELGAVKVGDEITYEISYRNYKSDKADVVIKDTLDKNVEFVSASDGGAKTGEAVFWTIKDVPAGEEGSVTLTVKVLEGALESNGGKGKVENGPGTTVKVGNDSEFEVETVTNPVPENPHKQEIAPYLGTGTLGEVEVGDEITYEISYKNYKSEAADVIIKDTLDKNVEFVSASNGGKLADGVVNWTIADVPAGTEGTVTLKVIVLEGARKSNSGPGKVVNGGDTTTVKVGNDAEYSVETVENPVPEEPAPEKPHKREITPYEGNGTLGEVKVGDQITYEISYKNYKRKAVDIVIKDTLDKNVEYVSSSDGGKLQDGVVIWTLKEVEAGKEGTVTLTVKVLSGALKANGGPGKVVNGGKNATVKVGDDPEFTLEVVENPVTKPGKPGEPPRKTRTGDENPVALYALLFAAAGGGLAVLLWRRRRRQE